MFEQIERLNLGGNSLVALPDAIGELVNLKSLTLSNNALASLPSAIGLLKKVTLLYLQNNNIAVLPDEIGQMASLQHLVLSKNQLRHLPGTLLRLPLETLYLDNNLLPPAPKFISYREGKGVARHLDQVLAVCELSELRQKRIEAERLNPPTPPLAVAAPAAPVVAAAAASTATKTAPAVAPAKKETATDRALARQDQRIARKAEFDARMAAAREAQKNVLAERQMQASLQPNVAVASPQQRQSPTSPIERLFPRGADVPRATFRAQLLRYAAEQKMLPVVDKAQLLALLDAIVDDIDLDGSGTISEGLLTYALDGKSLDDWLRSALSQPKSSGGAPMAAETPLVRELSQRRVIRAATLVVCDGDAKPKLLGKGGFGAVHKLHWTGGPFDVAVKSLLATIDDPSGEVRALFEREALLQADLTHDNILPIYGVVLDGPELSIVMPLMARSLYDAIHSGSGATFAAAEQARIGAEIASGLTYLHGQSPEPILHRDLKSLNVMLTARDEVKLVDFGLAQVKETIQSLNTASAARSGIAVNAVGTVQWQAPELFRIKPAYSPAVDIYALGVVMWELLAREIPFAGVNMFVIPGAVSAGERPTIPTEAPAVLAAIVSRCWAQNPNERPSALETVRAFRCAAQELPSESAIAASVAPAVASQQASSLMQLESRAPTMQADDW